MNRSAPRRMSAWIGGAVACAAVCGSTSLLSSCDDPQASSGRTKLRVQLDWVPEPEFGGLYAAKQLGLFDAAGLEVEIIGGAPGVPVAQMVASGTCEVGLLSGDQILTTRAKGGSIVALYATFEVNPTAVMVHESNPARTLKDLWTGGGIVATEPGLPWVQLMNKKYGVDQVRIVPTTGALASFIADPSLAQSIFITAEPVQMELQKIPVRTISVAESGYNPYVAVYCVNEALLNSDEPALRRFISALRRGWQAYQQDPEKFNAAIAALNPAMTVEAMNISAKVQHDYVENDETAAHGLGWMSAERWQATEVALRETAILKDAVDWRSAFRLLPEEPGR